MAKTPTEASTAKPQDQETLTPDTFTEAKGAGKATDKAKTQAPDPLLDRPEDESTHTIEQRDDQRSLKTTGEFRLMDPLTGKHFGFDEPTETAVTPWVQTQLDAKRLA